MLLRWDAAGITSSAAPLMLCANASAIGLVTTMSFSPTRTRRRRFDRVDQWAEVLKQSLLHRLQISL